MVQCSLAHYTCVISQHWAILNALSLLSAEVEHKIECNKRDELLFSKIVAFATKSANY